MMFITNALDYPWYIPILSYKSTMLYSQANYLVIYLEHIL